MCMGGQMPCRRPNQVSAPSMTHPIGIDVHEGVTKGKGRTENNFFLAVFSCFNMILCIPDKARRQVRKVRLFLCKVICLKRVIPFIDLCNNGYKR